MCGIRVSLDMLVSLRMLAEVVLLVCSIRVSANLLASLRILPGIDLCLVALLSIATMCLSASSMLDSDGRHGSIPVLHEDVQRREVWVFS